MNSRVVYRPVTTVRSSKILAWLLVIGFLASMLGIASCKKEEFMEVSGLMTDPNQGIQVEGVRIEIWTQKIESGIFSANYILTDAQTTSVDGRFEFLIPTANYTAVKLVFSKPDYFSWETTVNADKLQSEQRHFAEYQILPKAWIHFRVVNRDPRDPSDYFEFRLLNGYGFCEDCCRSERYQYSGASVDQEFICLLPGHQEILVQNAVKKDSDLVFRTDKFFIAAFDTTSIEFEY